MKDLKQSLITMKTRLILSMLIPLVILLSLLAFTFYGDFKTLGKVDHNSKALNIANSLGNLVIALQEEKVLSLLAQARPSNSTQKDLFQARQATDQFLYTFKDKLDHDHHHLIKENLKPHFQELYERFELLPLRRKSVDNVTATKGETALTYENIQQDLLHKITLFSRKSSDVRFVNTLLGYSVLLQDYIATSELSRAVEATMTNDKANPPEYDLIQNLKGMISAYESAFYLTLHADRAANFSGILKNYQANELSNLLKAIQTKNASALADGNRWLDLTAQRLLVIKEASKKLLQEEQKINEELAAEETPLFITYMSLSILLILASIIFAINNLKSLSKKLQDEVDILAKSGQEMSHSILEASSGTANTASAVTETTTTVEELKQTAQVAADKAKNVSDISDETLQILKTSEKSLHSTINGMNRIKEGINTISDSIIRLNEHSQTIGEIIETVNDLAEQSHLLAVNAAIEAAKAEHKGFAVVAQEVRQLAEQSKQATIQVRNILNDIQNATSAVVMATDQGAKAVTLGVDQSLQTNEAIRTISQKITVLNQAAYQIALSSQQQLIGVDQVTLAMGSIKDASHQQVANMRRIEAGINSLNDVGLSLKQIVK